MFSSEYTSNFKKSLFFIVGEDQICTFWYAHRDGYILQTSLRAAKARKDRKSND